MIAAGKSSIPFGLCLVNGYTPPPQKLREDSPMTTEATVEVDACGQQCPMPLLHAKRALNSMQSGERLRVLATDRGSVRDFRVFAEQSGHTLLASEERAGVYIHLLQKS